jgi:ribonuclease P protein component
MRGRSRRGARVVVYVARAPGPSRAAFVAGRRVGGAVVRNRARRLLREAWMALVPKVRDGHHVVLVGRREIVGAKANEVTDEVDALLDAAGVTR